MEQGGRYHIINLQYINRLSNHKLEQVKYNRDTMQYLEIK